MLFVKDEDATGSKSLTDMMKYALEYGVSPATFDVMIQTAFAKKDDQNNTVSTFYNLG